MNVALGIMLGLGLGLGSKVNQKTGGAIRSRETTASFRRCCQTKPLLTNCTIVQHYLHTCTTSVL